MRESFVIHTEYIEDLPEENKAEFLLYVYNYGAKGVVPELTGLAKTIWVKIQRRIDADIEQYEATINARSNAGKKHKGNQYTKNTNNLEQNGTNGTQSHSMEQNGTNGTVYDYVSDIDSDNEFEHVSDTQNNVCAYSFTQNDIKPLKITPQDVQAITKQVFEVIQGHNATHGNMHKMPISKNYVSFLQKEGRQLCELFRDFDANDVLQALKNYLRVADIDTWKSTFSFSAFCKNCNEYTPEYFSLDKYEKTDFSKDADNKPIQRFKERMSQDNRFDIATFLQHSQEWLEKGRPEGEAYFALQEEWYRQEDEKAVNYDA